MRKNNGGPAFPLMQSWRKYGDVYEVSGCYEGMTLRDYFAAKAVVGMFYPAVVACLEHDHDLDCDKIAEFCYKMADAMIEEREKER